ncbi:hypothetical protein KAR28_04145 [Candidatus Parcubacteria bacterium]|nr:hypothetical protein [Candidatus Parcubacteria bacterium]
MKSNEEIIALNQVWVRSGLDIGFFLEKILPMMVENYNLEPNSKRLEETRPDLLVSTIMNPWYIRFLVEVLKPKACLLLLEGDEQLSKDHLARQKSAKKLLSELLPNMPKKFIRFDNIPLNLDKLNSFSVSLTDLEKGLSIQLGETYQAEGMEIDIKKEVGKVKFPETYEEVFNRIIKFRREQANTVNAECKINGEMMKITYPIEKTVNIAVNLSDTEYLMAKNIIFATDLLRDRKNNIFVNVAEVIIYGHIQNEMPTWTNVGPTTGMVEDRNWILPSRKAFGKETISISHKL